ncbi:chitinase [Colletotrichum sp. SAR 10_66]|nr:chitinase [Colletotrichum sp. SAR 10_66]
MNYTPSATRRVLNKAMIDYDKIIADGYDKYFNFYADYVVSTSGEALNDFLENKGKDYFTCNVIEKITCCRQCHYKLGDKSKECQHCTLQMCETISSAWDEPAEWHNVSEPCPPDMSKRGVAPKDGGHQQQSIFWTLRESKKDAFWADVTAEVGAPQEKMPFRNRATYGARVEDRECGFGRVWAKESCHYENNWFNVPLLKDFQRNAVVNPKDDVKKALEMVGGLKDGLDVMELEMRAGQFDGVAGDVVDAVALPVFMVEESIKSMQHVAELGKDLEEQEKKALIMMFLMAVFFIMPAVGSVVGSLGFSTLGRVLMLLGEAGSLGQGIYGVVEDPESAPFLIFSLIMGANGLRDVGKVAKAARARRSMTTEQIGKLGPGIQGRLTTIDKVVDRSGWAPAMCKL